MTDYIISLQDIASILYDEGQYDDFNDAYEAAKDIVSDFKLQELKR